MKLYKEIKKFLNDCESGNRNEVPRVKAHILNMMVDGFLKGNSEAFTPEHFLNEHLPKNIQEELLEKVNKCKTHNYNFGFNELSWMPHCRSRLKDKDVYVCRECGYDVY